MKSELVDEAAEMLVAVHRGGPPVVRLPEVCRPKSIVEAQQIVDAVTDRLDLPVKGWKTYFPFKAGQPALLTPILTVLPSPARITPEIAKLRMIEPEIVFRAKRDLPPRDTPYGFDEVADAMEAVPAFEVLDLRFSDTSELLGGAPDALFEAYADNSMTACFVLGTPLPDWRRIVFPHQRVVTTEDGKVISDVRGGHPVFDPSLLLATGVDLLRSRGGIRAGQIIGNHTVAGILTVKSGVSIVSEFEGLGSVEATYADQ
jgi:2-keto-4-pentenoate hydratase